MTGRILPEIPATGARFSPRGGRWTLTWEIPEFPGVEAWMTGRAVEWRGGRDPRPDGAAVLEQVHGIRVEAVSAPGVTPACDASITTERNLALTVRVADCLPVFVVGPGGLGLAHAGWRGLQGGIIQRTVAALCALSNDAPRQLRGWIGPAIGPCCFEVGPEVAEGFAPEYRRAGRLFATGLDRPHLDLWAAGQAALRDAGLDPARIESARICTRCHQHLFHSYRGSGGRPGRIEAWLRRGGPA